MIVAISKKIALIISGAMKTTRLSLQIALPAYVYYESGWTRLELRSHEKVCHRNLSKGSLSNILRSHRANYLSQKNVT